jgi:outer membrane protein OmpA-like peptidoglycan-associated protein
MKKFFIYIFFAFLSFCQTYAQDSLYNHYGLYLGYGFNMHSTDFVALPEIPNCCPQFSEGIGSGFSIGTLYEMPIGKSYIGGIRFGFMSHNSILKTIENTYILVNGVGSNGEFTHSIEATLNKIGIEPRFGIRLFDKFSASAGFSIGYLFSKSYSQKEVTSIGTFFDSNGVDSKSSIRNSNSGDLTFASSMLYHIVLSAGYELPMNKEGTTLLVPEISYSLALNDVVNGLKWKANALTFGVGLKFSTKPLPTKSIFIDTVIIRDTTVKYIAGLNKSRIVLDGRTFDIVKKETDIIRETTTIHESYISEEMDPHVILAEVTASGLDEEGNESPVALMRIEEFLEEKAHAMLPYVFFDNNQSIIPNRYEHLTKEQVSDYDLKSLIPQNDLDVHHRILNIIGKRMNENKNSKLIITGCNSDNGVEKGNLDLSSNRAKSVRDYLINSWGINDNRFKIVQRNLPEIHSNIKSADGQAENRRIELSSNDPTIIDLFTVIDTFRHASPPQIRLRNTYNSVSPLKSWTISISQKGTVIKSFSGDGQPPQTIDWDLMNDQKNAPKFNEPIEMKLSIMNQLGDESTAITMLPTEVRTLSQKIQEQSANLKINKYNLVLFNVGKSDITEAHQKIISMVKSSLKTNAKVQIEGYTDRSGNSNSNIKLAFDRANSTSKSLGVSDTRVIGIGDKRLLYPNDTPEGRFLCRTVQILIQNPE